MATRSVVTGAERVMEVQNLSYLIVLSAFSMVLRVCTLWSQNMLSSTPCCSSKLLRRLLSCMMSILQRVVRKDWASVCKLAMRKTYAAIISLLGSLGRTGVAGGRNTIESVNIIH